MESKFTQFFQAYGEVIWFGGKVTALTFVSFVLMVSGIESILWLRNLIAEKGYFVYYCCLVRCCQWAIRLVTCREYC